MDEWWGKVGDTQIVRALLVSFSYRKLKNAENATLPFGDNKQDHDRENNAKLRGVF